MPRGAQNMLLVLPTISSTITGESQRIFWRNASPVLAKFSGCCILRSMKERVHSTAPAMIKGNSTNIA
jgi:hypothetical protein